MKKMITLGIDAGGFNTPSWLAFLDGDQFTLSMVYLRSKELDLPWLEAGDVAAVAVDAPQGLPQRKSDLKVRSCDKAACTPTKRLPFTRTEMERGFYDDGKKIAYQSVIHLGVDLFWHHRANIYDGKNADGKVFETYPRAVLAAMTAERLPSKRKEPIEYGTLVMQVLKERNLSCPGVEIPSDDQADAMLCAYVAWCAIEGKVALVGKTPIIDEKEKLIREGFIVLPDSVR